MIEEGVRHAGHEVGGARAEGRQADAGASGEPPVDVGHQGRALLVPGGDEANRAGRERI